jgi:hypothetical protein
MFRTLTLAALGVLAGAALPVSAQQPGFVQEQHFHVKYRLPTWQERTFDSRIEAERFAELKRSQGFEVRVERHGDHFHVRYRMTDWRTYRTVYSHALAHQIQDMLRDRGFQVEVAHH